MARNALALAHVFNLYEHSYLRLAWSSVWSVIGRRLVGFWNGRVHMMNLNG